MAARLLEDPIPINITIVGTLEWLRASIPQEDKHKYRYIVVQRFEDLDPVYSYLAYQPILGWDTETTGSQEREKDGLHPHSKTSRMVLFQIGTPEHAFLVQPELLLLYPHFKMLMENGNILHLGQNLLFDFKWMLQKYGIHVVNMWCTMLAEQVLTAGRRGMLANLRCIVRRHKPCYTISKETREEFITFDGTLTEKIVYYSARDIALLFPVYFQQRAMLEATTLLQVAQLEFDCIPATAEMELTGLVIDEARLRLTLEYNQHEADRVSAEIHRLYNEALQARGFTVGGLFGNTFQPQTINLGSTKEKLDALHRIGIPVQSTESEVLEQLDDPIGPLIAEWMGYEKIISTYCERLVGMVHPDTGRLHPRFFQMGEGETSESDKDQSGAEKGTTATGRYSSNAQQFPKEKKVYAKVTDTGKIAEIQQFFQLAKAA
jgi:DNA polymerase-1